MSVVAPLHAQYRWYQQAYATELHQATKLVDCTVYSPASVHSVCALTMHVSWLQLQSLMYLRKTVGNSVKWPYLGFNKWDTSRKSGKAPPLNASLSGSPGVSQKHRSLMPSFSQVLSDGALAIMHEDTDLTPCREAAICNVRWSTASQPVCKHEQL